MRIGGVDPSTLSNEHTLVLPRGESHLVFKAKGLRDMDEFDKLCPEPQPPKVVTKNGVEYRESDPNYQSVLEAYNAKRMAYMVIHTLAPTGIEWDTVDIENPKTWTKWEEEFLGAGLSRFEIGRIINLVLEANCLDEGKLEEARKSFVLGQQMAAESTSGHHIEPASSPSGERASG